MALFQIKEPSIKSKSKAEEEGQSSQTVRSHVVGIDLGTTHSLVATVLEGKLTLIPDEQGKVLLPSCIHVSESGQKLVGYSALKYLISDAYNTLFSIKRFMGKAHHDFDIKTQTLLEEVDGQLKIKTQRGSFYPIELSSEILRVLKLRAEKFLGAPVEGAVITVPAYFDDAQRIATKQAAQIAGLKVLRLINEPTAAAMAYGLETSASGTIAVYDFGGGTFDVSLLRLEQGLFEVLSTKGDTALGGDDIDILVAQWIVSQFIEDIDAQTCHAFWRYALGLAKDVKHRFTDIGTDNESAVDIEFSYEHHHWSGNMSVAVFHDLISPVIQKTLKICQKACHDAQIALSDIKHVVLVGGSTRTPSVVKAVTDFFKQVPLCSLSPDTVVAEGAALQADMLSGHSKREQVLLLDVNPLSLGLETMGGVVEKIIPRNSVLPITKTQSFTTYQDGQRALSLHILQGEREKVEDNRSLAKFVLFNLPDMPAGIPKIDVTFTVDIDGLLTVRAEEQRSKVSTEIEIKPTFGLSDESIYAQIKEAIENASSDIKARKHRERVFEANQLLRVIESGLKEDANLLSIPEQALLDEAIVALKEALNSDNTSLIYAQTQQLEKASEDFIERRLNKGLNLYLKNQKV